MKRGRPPSPLDPAASTAAWLGAELRAARQKGGLTLHDLAALVGYSPQHISEVERAKTTVAQEFIEACDRALVTGGRLMVLFPAALAERERQRLERAEARRAHKATSLRCRPREGEDEVKPVKRRDLLSTAATAAVVGLSAPAQARDVDPALVEHWGQLLNVLDSHDAMFGPRDVLNNAQRELGLIAEHRRVARGNLQASLQRVEARWAEFASWLARDVGSEGRRDRWAAHALRLARDSEYPDMTACVRLRQSQWAVAELDAHNAIRYAQAARQTPAISTEMQALSALRAAQAHALGGDADACQRGLADARQAIERIAPTEPMVARHELTIGYVAAAEARCWLWLDPGKAIALYEEALRAWPAHRTRSRAVHQARLARGCAANGELDRAAAEGHRALVVAQATRSVLVRNELAALDAALPATVGGFHEAFSQDALT
jgi:transcriptional regulator with XRE-family HTH domain